ncbi:prespore vesicle protein-like [Eriocheir sinensis]|uniref:prespore vesicle protein-like n=1 Tax=Eriocheir sinensis TaxID=95602 RepID=UPI0021CA8D16|nr:prespore vesicle protein-like [Eriocheir sinensis]
METWAFGAGPSSQTTCYASLLPSILPPTVSVATPDLAEPDHSSHQSSAPHLAHPQEDANSGGPAQKTHYSVAEEIVLGLIPVEAIMGHRGIPNPDQLALTQEYQDAATPAEEEEEEEEWRQVQPTTEVIPVDMPAALNDHLYGAFMGTQRQASRPRPSTAHHPYARPASHTPTRPASHTPTRPASHTPTRPASHTPTRPASHTPTRPASHTPTCPASHTPTRPASHRRTAQHPAQDINLLEQMFEVQKTLNTSVERMTDRLEQAIARAGSEIAAAIRCAAGKLPQ